jgi:hypothetical protein
VSTRSVWSRNSRMKLARNSAVDSSVTSALIGDQTG